MSVTVVVTTPELATLREAGVEGLEGYRFTYEPTQSAAIVASLDKCSEGYPFIAGRLANLASQFGISDIFFVEPVDKEANQEVDPEIEPIEPDPTDEH